MKVFTINSVCGIRSTGRICTDIGEQLLAAGHECRIAYGREMVSEKYADFSQKIGNELDVRIHGILSRVFDCAGFCSTAATRRLVQAIKDYNPDLIHLHNIHGYYLNVEILFDYLRSAGKPVVWTLHDCWPFTGHCAYFTAAKCNKWMTQCEHCVQKKGYPASFFLDRSRSNYIRKKKAFTGISNMTLVPPSQWLADLVKQSFLGEYAVEVIPNGIDTQVFQPTVGDVRQRYSVHERKIVLGVASAWDARKGLSDFTELAELLGSEYAVMLVGLTSEQKEQLPSGIIGITRTDSARELAELYSEASVLVNPTYEDNYPTVNLEAQACGTPVITYNTGGSVESVPEDCVVAQGDIIALADKIRAGTAVCKTDVSLDRATMLNKYITLYQNLLTEKNNS